MYMGWIITALHSAKIVIYFRTNVHSNPVKREGYVIHAALVNFNFVGVSGHIHRSF